MLMVKTKYTRSSGADRKLVSPTRYNIIESVMIPWNAHVQKIALIGTPLADSTAKHGKNTRRSEMENTTSVQKSSS